jgi:c-di-GMP-binding flagellar brake protein YcgR
MFDLDKISGNRILNILEQLRDDHTILNIHVMGIEFDWISIILDISDDKKPCFFIDSPERANPESSLSPGERCFFEFSDDNKIRYSFITTIARNLGKKLKFNFPEFIERSQRRKSFRVTVPSGTKLNYRNNEDTFKLDTINVSEGGVLASLKDTKHVNSIFFEGNKLNRLSLSTNENSLININIRSAEVVRVDKINVSGRVHYGIKFIDIDKSEQDKLKNFIYYCQRRVLKKRGGLGI